MFVYMNIYIYIYKAFIGRSTTPTTSKMEVFVKEVNERKLLINTKLIILHVGGQFTSLHIFPFSIKFLVCNHIECQSVGLLTTRN